jgi:predicted Zn-dependent protease
MVHARFFDGVTSRARDVELRPVPGALLVEGDGIAQSVPLEQIRIGEALARASRVLVMPGGARFEVEPGAGLDLLLELLGHRERRVLHWARYPLAAAGAALLTLALLAGAYRAGLPWLAEHVASALPAEWLAAMGQHTLAVLDRTAFDPSDLDPERRARIESRFRELRARETVLPAHSLHFRAAPSIGANALALPGGEIVLTDGLVELAQSDEEVLAVLSHELGHLTRRHALRSVIQASAVGAAVALWLGDFESLAAGFPAAILEARYSRDFEREADAYAAWLLHENGLGTQPLADLLARLEHEADTMSEESLTAYLSSHPATRERIRTLSELDSYRPIDPPPVP